MAFFYADADSESYDRDVRKTTPSYDLIHKALLDCSCRWLDAAAQGATRRTQAIVLDLGSGSGTEVAALLQARNDIVVVCIDHSGPMIELLREKLSALFGDETAGGRCLVAQADFRDAEWPDMVRSFAGSTRIVAAVSAYALHHLDRAEKAGLYRQIHDLLCPTGAFFNSDLFSFRTEWLARQAQQTEESWIADCFGADSASEESARKAAAWLNHVRTENSLFPLGSRLFTCGAADDEEALLRQAGFDVVEVPVRYYQSALVCAFRGGLE